MTDNLRELFDASLSILKGRFSESYMDSYGRDEYNLKCGDFDIGEISKNWDDEFWMCPSHELCRLRGENCGWSEIHKTYEDASIRLKELFIEGMSELFDSLTETKRG